LRFPCPDAGSAPPLDSPFWAFLLIEMDDGGSTLPSSRGFSF